MRPEILYPLFAPIESLKGVGPKLKADLVRLVGNSVWDLLSHIPRSVIIRELLPNFAVAFDYQDLPIIVYGKVGRHMPPTRRGLPYRVIMHDLNHEIQTLIELVFFHAHGDYLQNILPPNAEIIMIGKLDSYQGKLRMIHPQIIPNPKQNQKPNQEIAQIEPVYPLTQGVSRLVLGKIIALAFGKIPQLPEWLAEELVDKYEFPTFIEALQGLHFPKTTDALLPSSSWIRRLAFDELLANQLMLQLLRKYTYQEKKTQIRQPNEIICAEQLCSKILNHLPYQLTASQQQAFAEIKQSLQSENRMLRLLQGDVGTGKTIIALLAMVWASAGGAQAAIMAPTDLLARQHYENFLEILTPLGISCLLLTGKMKLMEKKVRLEAIASGEAQIIIGTHALFQEKVHYHQLRFAVIDEQHRFGVHQRLIFAHKAQSLDMMVMSATPIPRTLMLSFWNNLEVSRLHERPYGRKDIVTRVFAQERIDEIMQAMARAVTQGRKIYWVCPLIEESETIKFMNVTARAEQLGKQFGADYVEKLHGKMSANQKELATQNFIHGKAQILVATTVIEVGINVPEASIIVIEHAEQFGLAALHQLRGRVGRGSVDSFCLLVHGKPLSTFARSRLQTIREHHDGFAIAEIDLELRGGGDIFGIRQSGLPAFRFVDWHAHQDLIRQAQDTAKMIIATGKHLREENGKESLKILLSLYGHDNALKILPSG